MPNATTPVAGTNIRKDFERGEVSSTGQTQHIDDHTG